MLSQRGIISGAGDGAFRPDAGITREEFVKIIVAAFGLNDISAICNFLDVSPEDWSYSYIATAQKYGLVSGKENNTFSPKAGITREEAAVIIYNTAKFKNIPLEMKRENPKFEDESLISNWASDAVVYLYRCSIINGMTEQSFAPKDNITREQAAKLIYEMQKAAS